MPNWCNNTIKVQATKERIDEFEKFLNENDGKEWFTHFRPLPEELINEGWYEWSINNWGCKWNCDANDWQRIDENTISFWFDSPWGPPLALYEFMVDEEFDVRASYHEEGMAFVGEFVDGFDNCYEYEDLDSLDYIPEHLIEDWNLRDLLEDRMNDEDEDE
jgi:hypothetical protein